MMETDSCLWNVVFKIKYKTMDNVKNCDSYILIYYPHKSREVAGVY
jgi:hypothetical protein